MHEHWYYNPSESLDLSEGFFMLLRNFACHNIKCKLISAGQDHFHLGSASKLDCYCKIVFHVFCLDHTFFRVGAMKCAFNFSALGNAKIALFINCWIGRHVTTLVQASAKTDYYSKRIFQPNKNRIPPIAPFCQWIAKGVVADDWQIPIRDHRPGDWGHDDRRFVIGIENAKKISSNQGVNVVGNFLKNWPASWREHISAESIGLKKSHILTLAVAVE